MISFELFSSTCFSIWFYFQTKKQKSCFLSILEKQVSEEKHVFENIENNAFFISFEHVLFDTFANLCYQKIGKCFETNIE